MDSIRLLMNKQKYSELDNSDFIKITNHLWKAQIISTLTHLLLITLGAIYLWKAFDLFALKNSYPFNTVVILQFSLFILIVNGFAHFYSYFIWRRTSILWNPLTKKKNYFILLGFLTCGITTIFMWIWFEKIFASSTQSYTYERMIPINSKRKAYIDWIQLFFLILFGSLITVCFVFNTIFFIHPNLIGIIWLAFTIELLIPSCYYAWIAIFSIFADHCDINWKWSHVIFIMGLCGLYLFPITIVILLIKAITNISTPKKKETQVVENNIDLLEDK